MCGSYLIEVTIHLIQNSFILSQQFFKILGLANFSWQSHLAATCKG